MNNTMYKKVSIEEELPPMDEFVTCFYENGETMVFKRIQSAVITLTSDNPIDPTWTWTMRDGIADRTPKESKITHWLKEVTLTEDGEDVDVRKARFINSKNVVVDAFILEREFINKRISELTTYLAKPTTRERCSYVIYNYLLMKLASMEAYTVLLTLGIKFYRDKQNEE